MLIKKLLLICLFVILAIAVMNSPLTHKIIKSSHPNQSHISFLTTVVAGGLFTLTALTLLLLPLLYEWVENRKLKIRLIN